jgi:hypothetical protein
MIPGPVALQAKSLFPRLRVRTHFPARDVIMIHKINWKPVLTYVVLVGLPMLGVLEALQLGRGLRAPTRVVGKWVLQPDASYTGGSNCVKLLSLLKDPVLSMSQSGTHLVLSFNDGLKTSLTGSIEQTSLAASVSSQPESSVGEAGCDGGRIYLKAIVEGEPEQQRLSGTLMMPGCHECSPVSFTGLRQRQPESERR